MMIGSTSKQTLHLSISNNYSTTNDNKKDFKSRKENITQKNPSAKNSVNNPLKKNNPLKNLMDQKEKIADSRQKYLDRALSKNESPESIKGKLAEYDDQISEVDKQISELKLAEQKKNIGSDDKHKKRATGKNNLNTTEAHDNSKSDNDNEMMNNLVSISNNISAAKTLSAEKTKESGEKRVLDCEIKIDEGRGLDPIAKKKRVAKIKDNIENIEENIGDKLKTNISDDNSNNAVNKNEQSEKSEETADESTKDSKLLQAIKTYKENVDNKTKADDQKINSIA